MDCPNRSILLIILARLPDQELKQRHAARDLFQFADAEIIHIQSLHIGIHFHFLLSLIALLSFSAAPVSVLAPVDTERRKHLSV